MSPAPLRYHAVQPDVEHITLLIGSSMRNQAPAVWRLMGGLTFYQRNLLIRAAAIGVRDYIEAGPIVPGPGSSRREHL